MSEETIQLEVTTKETIDTILSYKDMDIDGIKKSVEDYKQKWEQSENDRKAFEYRTKVDSFVKSLGLKDDIYEKHVTDLILEKELKFNGDKLIGNNVVKQFREKYFDAFKSATPVPEFSVSTTGQSGVKDDDAFVHNKVVPETDAYRFAKYAEKSGITVRSETLADGSAVCNAITTANNFLDESEVDSENCILFITPTLFNGLLALDTL